MRAAATIVWTACLLLCWVVPPAAAAEPHVGRDHRLTPPVGFERLLEEDIEDTAAGRLELVEGLAPTTALDRAVYLAGTLAEPEALLVVARIEVDAESFASSRARYRYMLDRLHVSDRFEALMADGEVVLRPVEVGGREALEMKHPAAEGLLGVEEPATAALLVDGGTWILVVSLMVYDPAIHPVEETWADVRGSLAVEPPAAFARTVLTYGGIGLGALLVLVLLLRFLASRRPARVPATLRGVSVDPDPEASSGVRQAPSVAPAMKPVMPKRPMERPADTAEAPVHGDPAAPDEGPKPTAAPEPQAPRPLRVEAAEETTATPPPLPSAPEGATPPPLPAADGLPPPARPKPQKRSGLRPTLPAHGRYSG